jgi:MoxR-like ATPase
VRTLAQTLGLDFSRIQFTPDLMPADVIGTVVLDEGAQGNVFEFRKGPVFTNLLLADEINRATPKTQSALLEAMQEQRVTVGRTTHQLDAPYCVLATQNPLEMEGTYPLPEAQLDRFFFKLEVPFPSREELHGIVDRTTTDHHVEAHSVASRADILAMQALVRRVPVARHVQDYAIRVLQATHPGGDEATGLVRRFVRTGASPRGVQAMLLAAKIGALFAGRFAASLDDVKAAATPALRHRLLMSFEGEAEGIRPDAIIAEILATLVPAKA